VGYFSEGAGLRSGAAGSRVRERLRLRLRLRDEETESKEVWGIQ